MAVSIWPRLPTISTLNATISDASWSRPISVSSRRRGILWSLRPFAGPPERTFLKPICLSSCSVVRPASGHRICPRGTCGQLQLALDVAKPVLQWRSPQLETHAVEDIDHRALLARSTVSAEPIEDFKQAIRRRLEVLRSPQRAQQHSNAFIFVDMDSTDRSLADNLCEILDRYRAGYVLPLDTQDPGEYRRDLEDNLSNCRRPDGDIRRIHGELGAQSPARMS